MDLGFVGPRFTWARYFWDGRSIWERLDRGLATNSFFLKFPGTHVHHLRCFSSHHSPLLINLSGLDPPLGKKRFQFEEMWLFDDRCGETVEASWRVVGDGNLSGTLGTLVFKKVEKCGKDLEWWNRNCFGNVRRELEKKKLLLTQAEFHA